MKLTEKLFKEQYEVFMATRNGDVFTRKKNTYHLEEPFPFARIKSWEHCIKAFAAVFNGDKKSEDSIDCLCLNLGFFLASYGMMTKDSSLLCCDYKVHADAVRIILKYKELFCMDLWKLCEQEDKLRKLDKLCEEIRDAYKNIAEKYKGTDTKGDACRVVFSNGISNILLTKILLGTLGIVPAYDTCVCNAVIAYELADDRNFNMAALKKLSEKLGRLKEKIEELTSSARSVYDCEYYTSARIIDGVLWYLGYEIRKEQEKAKAKAKEPQPI